MPDIRVLDSEPPMADAIATLEDVLKKVREGHVSAVAVALVYRDGSTGNARSQAHSMSAMIGSVSVLHHELCKDLIGD